MPQPKRQKHTEAAGEPHALGIAKNAKAASAKTGLPLAAVRAAKDAGCPAWKQNGNIDADALVAWYAEHQDLLRQFSGVPNIEIEKALLARARRIDVESNTARKNEVLIRKSDVIRSWGRQVISAKQQFLSNVDSIVAGAAMKLALTPEQCNALREIVSSHTQATLKELAKGQWAEEAKEKGKL